MARPKKNNADYFSHDNSMRNHRKIKALRAEYGSDGFSSYVMLLETLTEADNFKIELKKELDWKLLAGDFGIDSEKIKKIFKLMEELELIRNNNGIISCESLNQRLQPLLDKREKDREYSNNRNRNNNGRYNNGVIATKTGVIVTETPQSKVNKSKVNNILLADRSANDNLIENKPNIKIQDLYNKLGLKTPIKSVYQWQDEANNATQYFKDGESKRSSIFKCFKDNQQKARIAFSDCKELGRKEVLYFLKVYNE